MNVVTKPTILYYINKYPEAKTALLNWHREFSKADFKSFNELKSVYNNASIVANNRVIFNIKGNNYRLIVSFDFKRQTAYIIWFGPHVQYDKIDAATVPFIDVD